MTGAKTADPGVFDPRTIDPETARFNQGVEKAMSSIPPLNTMAPQEIRDQRESGQSIWGKIQLSEMALERTIPGPAGDVPVRVFKPDTIQGVYLHIHGGGFMIGRAHHSDAANEIIANKCRVAVVSVDYRLAPEDPHPAGADDCEAVAVWLAENAESEFGSNKLLIGGESAGGNLSMVTLLRMRDRHSFTGFAGANLVFGVYDLNNTPSVRRWGDRNLILSYPLMEWFNDNYAPPDKRSDPDVSPLYADLSGLPPSLLTVGTMDPLLDDSLFMHSRLLAAGNETELAVYPGGCHGFTGFPIQLARQANRRIREFISGIVED